MAAAGTAAGSRFQASSPNCRRMLRSASGRRKGRSPARSTRQRNFSPRADTRAASEAAPSFSTASAGEKRPSSLTICSTRSFPVKEVRWARPVVTSQKAAPADRESA